MSDRAIIFIDGNNWYHSLKSIKVSQLGDLDYAKVSQKLVGPRTWVGTRYYIGRVTQQGNPRLYAGQRRFLSRLQSTSRRISTHLGRLESRLVANEAAEELHGYLQSLDVRIDVDVFHRLQSIARIHRESKVRVEKAVDVMIAVDMVTMAVQDEYDAAYLLSADGDFTPAVEAVKRAGRKVYVCSPQHGAQLARVADAFIRVDKSWFGDCYR